MEVLAVIGQILLIILYVVLALVVCLIVLPVVYKAKIVKQEGSELKIDGVLRWLFGVLYISFMYNKDGFSWRLRFFGIPVIDMMKDRKEKKRTVKVYEGPVRAKKQPTIKPGERNYKEYELEYEPDLLGSDQDDPKYVKDEKVFVGETKKNIFVRIGLTIKGIYDRIRIILKDIQVIPKVWPYLMKLLKHIRPRRIKGEAEFGFDDPASTGQLLGFIGSLYPVLPKKLEIIPNFQKSVFTCDLFLGGHLFLVYVIVYIVKILRLKEVKGLIKRISIGRRKNG